MDGRGMREVDMEADSAIRLAALSARAAAGAGPLLALVAACGVWAATQGGAAAAAPYALIACATVLTALGVTRQVARELQRLRRIGARLRAGADAMPDGLAVFDAADRLVFFNARYPDHLLPSMRGQLRIGRRFEEILRAALADGPIYHPDMGEDFPGRAGGASRPAAERARAASDRRPLAAHPREPDAGRHAGAPDPGHHRGAPPRRRAAAARGGRRAGRRPGGDHRGRSRLHLCQPCLRDLDRLEPRRGARPPATGNPRERDAFGQVLRGYPRNRRIRRDLAGHHRQPPPRRAADRAGDDGLAAARREGSDHPLRRGQARRHRGQRPGPRARRERGALPGGDRRPDRVHHPRRPRRPLDLHERGGGALHRPHSRGHPGERGGRFRLRPSRGTRPLRRPHRPADAGDADAHGRVPRRASRRQRALGAMDRHRHLRRRGAARGDPVHRPRDHRPQARRGRARLGRAAAPGRARGGARLLHRHRRGRPDRRVQRRRGADLRLRPRRGARAADGGADRAAAPARRARRRPGAAPGDRRGAAARAPDRDRRDALGRQRLPDRAGHRARRPRGRRAVPRLPARPQRAPRRGEGARRQRGALPHHRRERSGRDADQRGRHRAAAVHQRDGARAARPRAGRDAGDHARQLGRSRRPRPPAGRTGARRGGEGVRGRPGRRRPAHDRAVLGDADRPRRPAGAPDRHASTSPTCAGCRPSSRPRRRG